MINLNQAGMPKTKLNIYFITGFFCLVLLGFSSSEGYNQSQNHIPRIIFEDNYDSQPNWNTSEQYANAECSPIGYSDPQNLCPAANYPGYGTSKPYEGFRDMPYHSGGHPMVSIQRPPDGIDHTTGSGKVALVYYQFNADNLGYWAGDGILSKFFTTSYPEIYVRVWIKSQLNWQWRASGQSNAQAKILRVTSYTANNTSNLYNWFYNSAPSQIWDLYSGGYADAYRCDPNSVGGSNNYYCQSAPSSTNSYQYNDYQIGWSGKPLDGNWHRYDYHFKMNTVGQNNGVYEWAFDGTPVVSHTNVMWRMNGSTTDGWNTVSLGGNSNNAVTSGVDQWLAYDDMIISAMPIDGAFPGNGSYKITTTAIPDVPPLSKTSLNAPSR